MRLPPQHTCTASGLQRVSYNSEEYCEREEAMLGIKCSVKLRCNSCFHHLLVGPFRWFIVDVSRREISLVVLSRLLPPPVQLVLSRQPVLDSPLLLVLLKATKHHWLPWW